jgi:D-glycero-D-manno-heptose 1,7-bisphosphate phosphatase
MLCPKPAIFFDRDGTLVQDRGYTYRVEDFAWIRGAPRAMKRFHEAGLDILVVTNQGGIGLGIFTERDMHRFHRHLRGETEKNGAKITDFAFCVHHPNAIIPGLQTPCRCRKPKPGMILDLAAKWQIELKRSIMIGDSQSDVDAGLAAGCHAYRFDGRDLDLLAQDILRRHF